MRARLPGIAALLLALLLALAAPAALAVDRRDQGRGIPQRKETLQKVQEIVSRPEFAGSDEEEGGILLLLTNLLSDLVDAVKRLRETNRALYLTIVGWLATTVFVIVGHVGWTVWRGAAAPRSPGGARAGTFDPTLASRAARDPERMLALAEAEAAAGRPAAGVPWLYLALLFRLERAGRVEFDPARTALEYADALARRPADRALWLGFLDAHDPVVFGARDCTPGAFAGLRERARAPLPEAPPGGVYHTVIQ